MWVVGRWVPNDEVESPPTTRQKVDTGSGQPNEGKAMK